MKGKARAKYKTNLGYTENLAFTFKSEVGQNKTRHKNTMTTIGGVGSLRGGGGLGVLNFHIRYI